MLKLIAPEAEKRIEGQEEGTLFDLIKKHLQKLAKKVIGVKVNDKFCDLSAPIPEEGTITVIMPESEDGLHIMRHSAAHIMAAAVIKLFPETKVAIGPAIENGFYYDFDLERNFVPEDLPKIEKEMEKIINQNIPFVRSTMKKQEALAYFKEKGEIYKAELIEGIEDDEVSIYQSGDFMDLCAGPHVPSTSKIKAFKLLSIAGAYWRGDEKRQMLQRIYGTAFADKKALDDHLHVLEEAKKRDHRKLGKDLDLFNFYEEGGPGLVYWHPNGAFIRNQIETFWKNEHLKNGYELIYTPHIAKIDLWKTSGHWDFYNENMYRPMDIDGQEYILKPMNCPFHILIYNSRMRSYRELPIRFAELGTVYRYERSGALHGTLRVRGFTQDDAHIFCTAEQLETEMIQCVKMAINLMNTFGFSELEINLATRPEKYAGTPEDWDKAEATLEKALKSIDVPYVVDEGGAVFYGPKIDIKIKDALGRLWQGPTVQFDFNLSKRFNVTYKGSDGQEHYVYMVHRALLGSMERFMGCLTEHYAGAFPMWLCPTQVMVMPITENQADYAKEIVEKLHKEGIRAKLDDRNEKINFKIREAQLSKIPYMLVLGEKEVQAQVMSVRERKAGDIGQMGLDEFIKTAKEIIESKK